MADDGACYKGAVDGDGKKTGEGRYIWADGSMYIGQWKKNRFHGIGTLAYADGGEYKGNWLNDRKHGHGKMSFANSDVYEGDWKDGVMHGCEAPKNFLILHRDCNTVLPHIPGTVRCFLSTGASTKGSFATGRSMAKEPSTLRRGGCGVVNSETESSSN